MAQTHEGAEKARDTLKARYGEDYYSIMGRRGKEAAIKSGGSARGGFAARSYEVVSELGRKGGTRKRLSDKTIRAIRVDLSLGKMSNLKIAEKYNVSPATVSNIRNGKRYKDIQ